MCPMKILIIQDDAVLAAQLWRLHPGFRFLQNPDDLFFRPSLRHFLSTPLGVLPLRTQLSLGLVLGGKVVCRILREISQVPVLFVTGRRNDTKCSLCAQCGVTELIKPFPMTALVNRVKVMLADIGPPPPGIQVTNNAQATTPDTRSRGPVIAERSGPVLPLIVGARV